MIGGIGYAKLLLCGALRVKKIISHISTTQMQTTLPKMKWQHLVTVTDETAKPTHKCKYCGSSHLSKQWPDYSKTWSKMQEGKPSEGNIQNDRIKNQARSSEEKLYRK